MATRKAPTRRTVTPTRRPARYTGDPNVIRPATRQETLPIGLVAIVFGFISLSLNATRGTMLLYGDAVAHLGIARRIVDTNTPGLINWGGVWLPLPHLLMLPFIGNMQWWQNGMAGAWPSLACYVIGCMGMYRLARRVLIPGWALVATAFFGLNANLLYLATTAMTEPLFLALLVWIILLLLEFREAVREARQRIATNRLMLLGRSASRRRHDPLRRLGPCRRRMAHRGLAALARKALCPANRSRLRHLHHPHRSRPHRLVRLQPHLRA